MKISDSEGVYRSKLIAILEGLECENIPELVKEGTEDQLREIGITITNFSKNNKRLKQIGVKDFNIIKESLQYHFTGENNALEFYEGADEKATIKILENIQQTATKLEIELE